MVRPFSFLHTGDLGSLDADGYCRIKGRLREMIIRGGENVYPAEIEQCLELHPGVREAAVVGVDHPELGQEVKAIVVVADPAPSAEELARCVADLARFVAERLANFILASLDAARAAD